MIAVLPSLYASGNKEAVPQAAPSAPEQITITDCTGRTVVIESPVKRIAYNHLSIGEALRVVDAWELAAGRDSYIADQNLFPNQKDVPQILAASHFDLNYEAIYELGIDLFITGDLPMPGLEDIISKLEPDVKVVALNFYEPESMAENFKKLGLILGREEEAREYIEWYEEKIESISSRTALLREDEKQIVFHKNSKGSPEDLQTFTNGFPGMALGNSITGSINVAEELSPAMGYVPVIDPEWLASQEIDSIIVWDYIPGGYGSDILDDDKVVFYRDEIMKLPVLFGTAAIDDNRVYMMSRDFFMSPRIVIGYAYMVKWLYPELFADIEPKAIHQEYINHFLRVDFSIKNQGVYVYP